MSSIFAWLFKLVTPLMLVAISVPGVVPHPSHPSHGSRPGVASSRAPSAAPTASPSAPVTSIVSAPAAEQQAAPAVVPSTSTSGPPTPSAAARPGLVGTALSNNPAQPAAIVYGSTAGVAQQYARPGSLVVAGRDNYADPAFASVAGAGGHVLIYLDAIIDDPYGRYHQMLLKPSQCGPAVPLWPGSPKANDTGSLNDFRVGGVLQSKLGCVLDAMVAENPDMAGFFADDVGSRSWFPDINWSAWSTADRQAYRDGAIALTKTFRKVADSHGLIVIVNGTWTAGDGGGYPNAAEHGNALADGGFIEHHDGEVSFFGKYACSPQWASQSTVTRGTAFNFSVSNSEADRDAYARTGCVAYAAAQRDYGTLPAPWTAFRANGLPVR